MEKILDFVKKNNLIKPGEVIGVGVSGVNDSMCLLHFLHEHREALDIEVVAIHINHGIREESDDEALFVVDKCREMGVRVYKFTIDAPKIAKDRKLSLETAAREGRYGVFESLLKRDVIDKIALAHHQSDQAETILMHIFRGCGVSGAKGMDPIRDGVYIRPMLPVSKIEIEEYASINNIEYVEDASNLDTTYARNYVRNVVMKDILQKWPNAIEAINNFANAVSVDNEFINGTLDMNSLLVDSKMVQMPCSYFYRSSAIYSRMAFKALSLIGVNKDIERKHIELIKDLAVNMENGKQINLPYEVVVTKEYDYLTFKNTHVDKIELNRPFKCEDFESDFGVVSIKRAKLGAKRENGTLYFDSKKIPKTAIWRYREDGDTFTKFGGGTKKLKSFLIDKKIPVRVRDMLPVLADKNEVYIIAGVEISDKVKVDEGQTSCCKISVSKKQK